MYNDAIAIAHQCTLYVVRCTLIRLYKTARIYINTGRREQWQWRPTSWCREAKAINEQMIQSNVNDVSAQASKRTERQRDSVYQFGKMYEILAMAAIARLLVPACPTKTRACQYYYYLIVLCACEERTHLQLQTFALTRTTTASQQWLRLWRCSVTFRLIPRRPPHPPPPSPPLIAYLCIVLWFCPPKTML